MTDVERTVRVCARVLEHHPFSAGGEVPVTGFFRRPDRLREKRGSEPEVDVGAHRPDADIPEIGVRREPCRDIGSDLLGRPPLLLRKFKRYGRGDIGVIPPYREEDVLFAGACPEHALNLVVLLLKHQYPVL
ncbi:hypothetical protein DSECCO2_649640 [anaerobic digester metagenome]